VQQYLISLSHRELREKLEQMVKIEQMEKMVLMGHLQLLQ
jgi:hypothetical protein